MEPIGHITIVGGGTAGWMSASYLMIHLNRRLVESRVSVTLIESPNVKTVGVGEATVPAMMQWLQDLGVAESEFMARCNASFKLGVRFVGWDRDPATGEGLSYINPFDGFSANLGGFNPACHFHEFEPAAVQRDLWAYLSPMRELVDRYKGPRPLGQDDFQRTVNYAYHLDAGLFAEFLKEMAICCGVEHVRDDVVEVTLDERGYVCALELAAAGRFPTELVIDCTGFRGLIIQQSLGVPFESYDRYLLNDRALAVQLPHREPTRLEPCTRSTALGAGWSWQVPLYSRVGTGYVFSSAFRSDGAATDEFMEHLGAWGEGAEPRALGMRIGRCVRSWEKNCVAIGLSGGFIEPLESTAIFMISAALQWLTDYFPDRGYDPVLSRRFNRRMEALTCEIRDFIVLHYHLSNRGDSPYWEAARRDVELPDSLRENLALFRHALPRSDGVEPANLFGLSTYIMVLFAKGYFEDARFPTQHLVSRHDWTSYLRQFRSNTAALVKALPDHYELLSQIRASAAELEIDAARAPEAQADGAGWSRPVLSEGNVL